MYMTACDLGKSFAFHNKKSQSNLGRVMSPPLTAENYSTKTPNLKSMFAHYEDMKNNAKCKNWGSLGVRGHQ